MPDGLTLILPDRLEAGDRHWLCTTCGAKFEIHHEARWERHVVKCFKANREHVEAKIAGEEGNVFQSAADKELYQHLRKGGN